LTDAQVADNLTIDNGTINNTPIGQTTPAAGTFTNLQVNGTLHDGSGTGTTGQVLAVASDGTPEWKTLVTYEHNKCSSEMEWYATCGWKH
jgi:hypothetical protein